MEQLGGPVDAGRRPVLQQKRIIKGPLWMLPWKVQLPSSSATKVFRLLCTLTCCTTSLSQSKGKDSVLPETKAPGCEKSGQNSTVMFPWDAPCFATNSPFICFYHTRQFNHSHTFQGFPVSSSGVRIESGCVCLSKLITWI